MSESKSELTMIEEKVGRHDLLAADESQWLLLQLASSTSEVRRLQAQKSLDDQTYAALKAELAKSESEVRRLLAELAASCDGCDAESRADAAETECLEQARLNGIGSEREAKLESEAAGLKDDLAAAQTKIEAQSKRISWMAGDALKAKADLAAAKARASALEEQVQYEREARQSETNRASTIEADLSQARAECARLQSENGRIEELQGVGCHGCKVTNHEPDPSWLSHHDAEVRGPLVEALTSALHSMYGCRDCMGGKHDSGIADAEAALKGTGR